MKKIIVIAWRNLWRNKRRTLITLSSIFFALFYAIVMRSFTLGTYNQMLNNSVTQFSGHLQIQDKEYFDNPIIDFSFPFTQSVEKILNSNEEVLDYFPTIRTGVLASSGDDSKVAMITGVDFKKEIKHRGLNKTVARYFLDSVFVNKYIVDIDEQSSEVLLKYKNRYYNTIEQLREDLYADGFDTVKYFDNLISNIKLPEIDLENIDKDIVIGHKLAKYLNLNIGDSLILFGQGFRGNTAIGKYLIAGFLNFPVDNFNRLAIYMNLKTTQNFLSAYDVSNDMDTTFFVNYIAINSIYQTSMREQDYDRILKIKDDIEAELNDDMLTVLGWRKLNGQLVETIQIGNAKGFIFTFIFYLIIAFGVLGTVMMLLAERKREFGVMMALGMKRRMLSGIISFELIFMGILASLAGIIFSTPLMWLGNKYPMHVRGDMATQLQNMNMEPILILEKFGPFVIDQIMVVFGILLFILLYALRKISKLKVISSLRA